MDSMTLISLCVVDDLDSLSQVDLEVNMSYCTFIFSISNVIPSSLSYDGYSFKVIYVWIGDMSKATTTRQSFHCIMTSQVLAFACHGEILLKPCNHFQPSIVNCKTMSQ